MKKVIIGLSGLIVLTFFIIFAVDAKNNDKEVRKANTEITKNISPCPSLAMCPGYSGSKMANCSKTKCPAMNCDASKCKEGKCDPAACKTNCQGAFSAMKCGPMNCNR